MPIHCKKYDIPLQPVKIPRRVYNNVAMSRKSERERESMTSVELFLAMATGYSRWTFIDFKCLVAVSLAQAGLSTNNIGCKFRSIQK